MVNCSPVKLDIDVFLMCNAEKGADIDTLDIRNGARSYLKKGGLTDEQIASVEAYITSP